MNQPRFLLIATVLLGMASCAQTEPELLPIFSGTSLAGWVAPEGNDEAGWYQAVDGELRIQSSPDQKGSILWTEKSYGSFLLEFEFKFGEGVVDSGIHIRDEKEQIQIGISGSLKRDMTGSPYIAGKGYPVEASGVADLLKPADWNTMKLQAVGNHYLVWLNGTQVLDFTSDSSTTEGPLGIQLHAKRDMAVTYRNLRLAELD